MPSNQQHTSEVIAAKLHDFDLRTWCLERLHDNDGSWHRVARELYAATDGVLSHAPQTLERWYGTAESAA